MGKEVVIGHTDTPELMESMFVFYFNVQGFKATVSTEPFGDRHRVTLTFEDEETANAMVSMHHGKYRDFVGAVFNYMIDAFYELGDNKYIDKANHKLVTPKCIAKQLLEISQFRGIDDQ